MANPAYARFAHVGARRVVLARRRRRHATLPTPRRYFAKPAGPATPAGTAANQSRVCFACPKFSRSGLGRSGVGWTGRCVIRVICATRRWFASRCIALHRPALPAR
jgi:hypothetical protein